MDVIVILPRMFVAGAVVLGRGVGRLVVGGGGYGLSGVVVACVAAVGRGIIDAGSGLRGGSSAAGV